MGKRGRKPGFITGNETRDQKIVQEFNPKEYGILTRLAHDYGVTKERIRQIFQRHGIQVVHGFTPEEEARIIQEYRAGVPIYKIARKFQAANRRIGKVLQDHGVSRGRPHPEDLEVARLYHAGMSVERVARAIKRCPYTVRKRLAAMNIEVKARFPIRGQRPDLNDQEIIQLYRAGMTYRDIAAKFNCSWKSIYNRIVKHGSVGSRG